MRCSECCEDKDAVEYKDGKVRHICVIATIRDDDDDEDDDDEEFDHDYCKSIGDGNLKYNPNTGLCALDEDDNEDDDSIIDHDYCKSIGDGNLRHGTLHSR